MRQTKKQKTTSRQLPQRQVIQLIKHLHTRGLESQPKEQKVHTMRHTHIYTHTHTSRHIHTRKQVKMQLGAFENQLVQRPMAASVCLLLFIVLFLFSNVYERTTSCGCVHGRALTRGIGGFFTLEIHRNHNEYYIRQTTP